MGKIIRMAFVIMACALLTSTAFAQEGLFQKLVKKSSTAKVSTQAINKAEVKLQAAASPVAVQGASQVAQVENQFKATNEIGQPIISETKMAKLDKAELVREIQSELDSDVDMIRAVPGIKAEKDSSGKNIYTYMNTKLEDMDQKTLESILNKIYNYSSMMNTERIQGQLQAANAPRAAMHPSVIPQQSAPISNGPSIPRTIQGPPQTPRIPTTPQTPQAPQIPSTRR